MPKATTPTGARQVRRHNPLENDITAAGPLKNRSGKRKSRSEDNEEKYVGSKASRKILRMGQELADEDEEKLQIPKPNTAFDLESRLFDMAQEDESEDDDGFADDGEVWGDPDEVPEVEELSPEDRATFERFFPVKEDERLRRGWDGDEEPEEAEPTTDLGALILQKIQEHEAAQARQGGGQESVPGPVDDYEIPPKVVEVYSKVGLILSRYKSGKLPKVFKILPTVPHWEDIIEITQPDKWTANSCYAATKLFVSAKPATAQRFFEMILLEKVREDIHETKKLNPHLFNALKKGLYKPQAWFKGILFPLVTSGTCTLREAHIISGVLVRISIPLEHSAAAIKILCEIAAEEASAGTEGGGATNVFIKALLDKRYALPYQVIDALVFHFLRYRNEDPAESNAMSGISGAGSTNTRLPVIWHQCLLSFAQRYRDNITEDQREALLDLLLTKGHSAIGPEVRRELLAGRGRGVPLEVEAPRLDGDDTMVLD